MSFKKPFRAPPIRLSADYRACVEREGRLAAIARAKVAARAAGLSVLVAAITWTVTPLVLSQWTSATPSPEQAVNIEQSIYYNGCSEARAASAAPIYRGNPGYREGMDVDGDGVACEPYPS